MIECLCDLKESNVLSLKDYINGINLSNEQKSIIKDQNDTWKISLIENLLLESREIIGRSFNIRDNMRKHYAENQKNWLLKERFFLGERLNHAPNSNELDVDMQQTNICQRFRLFYILSYPENAHIHDDISQNSIALAFLKKAERISGKNYASLLHT